MDLTVSWGIFSTLFGWAARRKSSIQRSLSAAELHPKQWLFSELMTFYESDKEMARKEEIGLDYGLT